MNIISLYQDFGVNYASENHKHTRPGWVNTACPFCISEPGHEGYHLGYDLTNNRYKCWRCGSHPVTHTISKLLGVSFSDAKQIVQQYALLRTVKKTEKVTIRLKGFKFPSGISNLSQNHKNYLIKRNFDPEKLVFLWDLYGTGPISILDNGLEGNENKQLNYKHRIIIPFYWNDKIVSFDSRDITGKALNKYQACPLVRELIPHKEILYGNQKYWKDTIIIVEGPTDVWRFGVNSAATSGIQFTPKQVRFIAKNFKHVPVVFDGGEPQAIQQANKLVSELKFRGVDSFRVDIIDDPGSMKQSEADYLVKQLLS
ncbi:MAG: hypothetical protein WC554_01860 [Clostridia bacterium]